MNKVFLIGNLTKDVEKAQTNNGITYAKFTLAVNRPYAKESDQKTDFFNVTVWRELAENCARFLSKGKKAAIAGSIQLRTFDGTDGSKKISVDIVASDVEFLSPRTSDTTYEHDDCLKIIDEELPF